MHHPLYSSGMHGNNLVVAPLWAALSQGGADVVLAGHDHHYERFAAMDAAGQAEPAGMRMFIVGTGGKGNRATGTAKPTSELRDTSSFGYLRLGLTDGAYTWQFVATAGGTNADSGSASCR